MVCDKKFVLNGDFYQELVHFYHLALLFSHRRSTSWLLSVNCNLRTVYCIHRTPMNIGSCSLVHWK